MRWPALSIAALFAACSAGTTAPAVTPFNTITVMAGDNQTAVIRSFVAIQPSVKISNQDHQPVAGVTVTFAVALNSGSITGATQVTDSAGIATLGSWKIGAGIQANTLTASAAGVVGSPVTFTAMGIAAPVAATLSINDGNFQTAHAGVALPKAPSVKAIDNVGNPIAGLVVFFAVTAGGGTITQPSATTDALGIASAGSWTLGPAVSVTGNTLAATATGLTGSPVGFTAYALGTTFPVVRVGVGTTHTCAALPATTLFCWGNNDDGQLGDRSKTQRSTPVVAGATANDIGIGDHHTCTGESAFGGRAFCWGRGGLIGNGTLTESLSPTQVAGGQFVTISAGGSHSCGIVTFQVGVMAGPLYCWGDNSDGAVGDGTRINRLEPVVIAVGTTFRRVAAGARHSCATTVAGPLLCWGANESGQLGDGTTVEHLAPLAVTSAVTFDSLAAGAGHTCALTSAGAAWCWGDNSTGALGDGTTTQRLTPVAVSGGFTFKGIGAGNGLSCGLTSAGAAYCWGASYTSVPSAVPGGLIFTSLAVGGGTICGITAARDLYCWGSNTNGQLGDGTTTDRTTPTAVHWP